MLSDSSNGTLSFEIPTLPGSSTPHPEEDFLAPLNFDDLLDIAREFEFTRTITHVWPCEEDLDTCHEARLDEILAAIVPTPNAGESPVLLASSAPSMTIDQVHVQEIDVDKSASTYPAPDTNAIIPNDLLSLAKDTDQVRAGTIAPITSTLCGWTPPNGSQFLDLDDSLMFPQPATDIWNSPWLAMFLATSSTQPVSDVNHSSATASVAGDSQPQALGMVPRPPHVSTASKKVDNPKKKGVPTPVQSSTRAIPEPVRVRSAVHTNSNVPSQPATASQAKTSKSRPHPPPTPATGGVSTANYVRAPRGGIPPHIARSVTQANILRVEKERKVIQDTFSSTIMGEVRKPSVLRKAVNIERETSKRVNHGGVSGKKTCGWDENDEKGGRVAKRARV